MKKICKNSPQKSKKKFSKKLLYIDKLEMVFLKHIMKTNNPLIW